MFKRIVCFALMLLLYVFPALSEDDTAFISDQESADELILSAMEIYSWFTISPLDVDPELTSEDGSMARVADESLCIASTMQRLLDFTFSQEIIQELMAYETYTVIDGILYGSGGGRGIDPNISEVEYAQTFTDEGRVEYTVTVHYLGEGENGVAPENLLFVREEIDGLWLFTRFPFFW